MNRKLGVVHLLGRAATPSNTTSTGPRFTAVPSGILIHPAVPPKDMGQKLGGVGVPFFSGHLGPHGTQSRLGRGLPPYHGVKYFTPCSIPSGVLVHPVVWPQWTLAENWGLCPFRGGGAGSPSNTISRRTRPTSYQVASLSMQPFDNNRGGPKIGGAPLLIGEGWVLI